MNLHIANATIHLHCGASMTVKAIMPVRFMNPVEPLGHKPTERRIRNISRSICSDSAQFAR